MISQQKTSDEGIFLRTEDAKLGAKFGQFFNLRKINLFLNISDLNPEIWKFTLGHFAALVHFVQPTNQSNFLPFFGLPVPEIDATRGLSILPKSILPVCPQLFKLYRLNFSIFKEMDALSFFAPAAQNF